MLPCRATLRTYRCAALFALVPLALVPLLGCGGATDSANDAGAPPDGSASTDATSSDATSVDGGPGTADAACAPVGRPSPPACLASALDAGSFACTTVADCQDAGMSPSFQACRAGQCAFDQCLTDSDCPIGQACGCASDFRGNGMRINRCIATQCRTDGDCLNGQRCSPSYGAGCGSLDGFHCHSSADTCASDGCCASNERCGYAPELGHFACQAVTACGG